MESFNLGLLLAKTLSFSWPVLLVMGGGLFVAELLAETGLLEVLGIIGRPLSRFAHLPDICGVAVAAGVVSPLAANAMLQDFRERGLLTDRETFFASILNGTIAPIKETFTYQLPVVLPALGMHVGMVYIGTLWLGSFVLLLFVMICGRVVVKPREVRDAPLSHPMQAERSFKKAALRWGKRFGRIGGTFLVVTTGVFILIDRGVMKSIEDVLVPLASSLHLPSVVFPSVVAYIASPLVGISMMGSLVHGGTVTDRDAIVALLFGSVFMLPLLYVRLYIPQWIAIFGVRLGMLRGLTSGGLVMATRIVVLCLFLAW